MEKKLELSEKARKSLEQVTKEAKKALVRTKRYKT